MSGRSLKFLRASTDFLAKFNKQLLPPLKYLFHKKYGKAS